MSEPETKEGEEPQSGTVMQCGATDYWAIGRTKEVRIEYPSLPVPTRLKALEVSNKMIHQNFKTAITCRLNFTSAFVDSIALTPLLSSCFVHNRTSR